MADKPRTFIEYADRGMNNTDMLAFRCVAESGILHNLTVLDLGCGAGRSTRFIHALGNKATGIDISAEAISSARILDPQGNYHLVEQGAPLPFGDAIFDAVFSSWMILEVGDDEDLLHLLKECRRVIKDNGDAIFVTNTPAFYRHQWLSCRVDHEENKAPLVSGQKVKVTLVPEGITFEDYFREDEHYRRLFLEAGFTGITAEYPLGRKEDQMEWTDELKVPPYAVYFMKNRPNQD